MKREPLAAGVFLLLAAGLLVGQRFGFVFAGGTGYEKGLTARIVSSPPTLSSQGGEGDTFTRGETIRTDALQQTLDLAGLGTVFLDTQTTLTLERFSQDEVLLRLETGRVAVEATTLPIEIRMDVVEADLMNGRATFRNIPTRRLVQILPVTGVTQAARRGETRTPVSSPSVLFYDRADREPAALIDNLPKTP